MKKHLLPLLAALAFTIGTASAQTATTTAPARPAHAHKGQGHKEHTTTERAAHKTAKLTKALGLSPDQSSRVQQIMTARAEEMQAQRTPAQPGASRAQLGEQLKANRAKYDAQLKEVLSADQYTKYTQMEAEHQKKRHDKGAKGSPAGTRKSKVKVK